MGLTWFPRRQEPKRIGLFLRSHLQVEQLEDRTACSVGVGVNSLTFGVTPDPTTVESRLVQSAPDGSLVQVQTDSGASFQVAVNVANNVEQMQINMQTGSADASALSIGDHLIRITLRDVNHNGSADIVVRDVLTGARLVLQGTGQGVFLVPHPDQFINADPFGANVPDGADGTVRQLLINFGSIDIGQIRTFVASALENPHCFAEFERNLGHPHLLATMDVLPSTFGTDGNESGRSATEDEASEPATRDGAAAAACGATDLHCHLLALRPRADFSSRGSIAAFDDDGLGSWPEVSTLQARAASMELAPFEGLDDLAPPVLSSLLGTDQAVVPTLLAAPRPRSSAVHDEGQSGPAAGSSVVIGLGAAQSGSANEAARRSLLDRVFVQRRERNTSEQDCGDAVALAWRLIREQSAPVMQGPESPDQGPPKATTEGAARSDSFPLVAFLMDAIFGESR